MIKKNFKTQAKKVPERAPERARLASPPFGQPEREKLFIHSGLVIRKADGHPRSLGPDQDQKSARS